MKKALLQTLMHIVELVVILLAAWFVIGVLIPQAPGISQEVTFGVITLVVAAIAKFARAHKESPVPDYVEKADKILPL